MKTIALGCCLALAACTAKQPEPMPLALSGQPLIVTSDTQIAGHGLKTIGELRESDKKCAPRSMAIGALTDFPKADAVVGYREQQGACHVEITAGGDYSFCGVVCQAKVVKFVDNQPSP
jgi:hypothetical protein